MHGFVYVRHDDPGPMAQARAGARVTLERTPPWIVVDHALDRLIVAGWPGRLWRVAVVAAEAESHPGVGYTRAMSIDVHEELPVARLFGAHGDDVVSVIDRASALDAAQAVALAEARHPAAADAYARAWAGWLARPVLGGVAARPGAPIGYGFTVILRQLQHRARSVAGDEAFTVDDGEESLCEPWDAALGPLLDAAMALGAPDLSPAADRDILMAAWRGAGFATIAP